MSSPLTFHTYRKPQNRFSSALFYVALCGVTLFTSKSFAAPCCAGSSQGAAMITGDEAMKFQFSAGSSDVVADAPVRGLPTFREGASHETTQTLKLGGAHIFKDRFQAGAGMSFQRHDTTQGSLGNQGSGLGDISVLGAYEFLPEWGYSAWKPKGYVFTSLTLPTGKSIYESEARLSTDVTGQGLASQAVGVNLTKRWSSWDVSFSPEIDFYFARQFPSGLHVSSGPGVKTYLGSGYSFAQTRVGAFLQSDYLSPKTTRESGSTIESKSGSALRWDTGLEATYLTRDDWGLTASYIDQTLVGPARNTTLSRTVSITIAKRFLR